MMSLSAARNLITVKRPKTPDAPRQRTRSCKRPTSPNTTTRAYGNQKQLCDVSPEEEARYRFLKVVASGCAGGELFFPHDSLSVLEPQTFELTHLTNLILGGNALKEIPVGIGRLKNLAVLDLGLNEISTLPEEMFGLTRLTILNLQRNKIERISERLGNLTLLTELFLSENRLKALPANTSELVNLMYLDVSNNGLTHLPDLSKLSRLEKLVCHTNAIVSIEPVVRCGRLRYIGASGNLLERLPEGIGKMNSLADLWVNNNRISKIPSELAKSKRLRLVVADVPLERLSFRLRWHVFRDKFEYIKW